MVNVAPDWFILELVRRLTGAEQAGAATAESIPLARQFLKDWLVARNPERRESFYDMIKEKLKEAFASRAAWVRTYPDASLHASLLAYQMWSDVRTMPDTDAWPHFYIEHGVEIVLLQLWKSSDAEDAKPMLCVAGVVGPGDRTSAALAFSKVMPNIDRLEEGEECWNVINPSGYIKLNHHAVHPERFRFDQGSFSGNPGRRPRNEEATFSFGDVDFGPGMY